MYDPRLNAFIAAADCGSFTKASEKLYISPTAVMKQINTLEDSLGLKLISRTNQGIRLTPAGQSVYKDARFMIDYSERRWSVHVDTRRNMKRHSAWERHF